MSGRVTVQVCTKDRFSELALLLSSLRFQTFVDWDLLIVDASRPSPIMSCKFIADLVVRIRCEGHKVAVVNDVVGVGPCLARNLAVTNDWNDIGCRVDDDSVLDKDYLARLYKTFIACKPCAVGGLVPVFGNPDFVRNISKVVPVFNAVKFDDDNNVVDIKDDGGVLYNEHIVIPSDHLRSSFMFWNKHAMDVGLFPVETGRTGWREETIFCFKLKWAGVPLYTDTGAVAWHLGCPSGGVRCLEYGQEVALLETNFKRWARVQRRKKGAWKV